METLELPTGEEVTPEDAFLFGGYPYRFVPREGEGFALSPLYWGGGDMDVPFPNREALVAEWGADGEARGPMSDEAWRAWVAEARADDRFGDEELDAVARELGIEERSLLGRLRDRLTR
ncbi:hypothetical protein [Halorarius halobius]|uniref:hypothetical protein n=1 Tax=Halorarius halobius TaxID=2962671 RepID=UPI0020CDF5FB|nr:hypothetical protein [Halorarius halobius]